MHGGNPTRGSETSRRGVAIEVNEKENREQRSLNSRALAEKIARLSLQKKAQDVVILDLRKLTSITDFFVICTGETDVQVKAITDHIEGELEKEDIRVWHREGYEYLRWVLLDYVDVVAHVFQPETRSFYALESLWGDAEITEVKDED